MPPIDLNQSYQFTSTPQDARNPSLMPCGAVAGCPTYCRSVQIHLSMGARSNVGQPSSSTRGVGELAPPDPRYADRSSQRIYPRASALRHLHCRQLPPAYPEWGWAEQRRGHAVPRRDAAGLARPVETCRAL